ncbi:hypothetical protein HK097_007292, partial [Rhizophlyctis rosea]
TCAEILAARHNVLPVDLTILMFSAFDDVLGKPFPLDSFYGILSVVNSLVASKERLAESEHNMEWLGGSLLDAMIPAMVTLQRDGDTLPPLARRVCTEAAQGLFGRLGGLVVPFVERLRTGIRELQPSNADSAAEISGFVKVVSRFLLAPELRRQVVSVGVSREAMSGFLQDAQVALKASIGGDTAFQSLAQDFLLIQNGINGTLST